MKRVMKILLAISLVYAVSACKEKMLLPEPTAPSEHLEILWRTPIVLNPETEYTIAMNPVIHGKHVIFSTEHTMNSIRGPLLFIDSSNGSVQHYWGDFSSGSDAFYSERTAHEGDYLVLRQFNTIDCINLVTRQKQWHTHKYSGLPFIYANEGYVYAAISFNNERSNAIIRSPLETQDWDTLYSFTKTDKYKPDFIGFGFGQLSNGDEVIVWKNRNWGANGFLTDIFAFNISADTLLWRNRDLDLNSLINPLQVIENRVIGDLRTDLFSIDLETGELIWRRNVQKSIINTYPIASLEAIYIGETSIVVKGSSDELVGLVKRTGDINWVQDDNGLGLNSRFTYFEGKLFFASGGLRIVDAQNGDPLISQALSEEIDNIQSNIVIDPDRRVMYFHNGREAFCVRIPPGI